MRINKFLAHAGIASRRNCDILIQDGEVTINGEVAKSGDQVSDQDVVMFEWARVQPERKYYIAFYKPVDCLCSHRKEDATPLIYDFLPNKYSHARYAGRLDRNTSGLILMSNDGDWINELTHPSRGKKKTYSIESGREISDYMMQMFEKGIQLDEGLAKAKCKRISDTSIEMVLETGYNRQIRRMADEAGMSIKRLKRIAVGLYKLDDYRLKPGKYIEIEKK